MRSEQFDLSRYDTDKIPNGYLDRYDPFLSARASEEIALLELGVSHGGSLQLWRDYFPMASIVGIDIIPPKIAQLGDRIAFFRGRQEDTAFLSHVASKTAPDGFDVIIDDASHVGELTRLSFWHLFTHHLKPGGLYAIEDWGTGYWDDWPDGKRWQGREESKRSLRLRLRAALTDPRLHELANRAGVAHFMRRSGLLSSVHQLEKVEIPSHLYGMVGFIKELVDEQGAADATAVNRGVPPPRPSRFDSLTIQPGVVFVKKASAMTGDDTLTWAN